MMPSRSSSSSQSDDQLGSHVLNFQRDLDNLNPAVLAAILNERRGSFNPLLNGSLFHNEFLHHQSAFSSALNNNTNLFTAFPANDFPFHHDQLPTTSLSRAQQHRSAVTVPNITSSSFNGSLAAGPICRRGGLFESRNILDTGILQRDVEKFDILNVIHKEALVSDAYQRGRQEAILSLLRTGAVATGASSSKPISLSVDENEEDVTELAVAKDSMAKELATSLDARRKSNAPYFDASSLEDPDEVAMSTRRTRGGVTEPFPEKLHRMLRDAIDDGNTDIISFYPHGRAFGIHNQARFCREIMPRYFKQSRLSSFQRQLNLYGFQRISSGPDCGGYYHELLLKGRPALAIHMRRVGVSQGSGKVSIRLPKSTKTMPTGASPDFYSMPPIQDQEDNSN